MKLLNKKWIGVVITIVFLFSVSTTVSFFLKKAEKRVRERSVDALQTVLYSTYTAISETWAKGHIADAIIWASDADLIQNTKELLNHSLDSQHLISCIELRDIRAYFEERLKQHDALGIFVISPEYISLASMRDENIGAINLISTKHKDRLEKVFQGQPQIIPPMRSDVPLPDKSGRLVKNYPTMFVVVPMFDENEKVIAALSIRLNLFYEFTTLTQTGRIGNSGETYIFNDKGTLLTESRFNDGLVDIGLINEGDYSILNVEIRNPGVNLFDGLSPELSRSEQPLTFMAQDAITNNVGSATKAYRDYRGVPVIGAWLWDDELNLGFTTEIDEEEVLLAYIDTRNIALGLLTIALFLTILFFIYVWLNQRRYSHTLELLVDERTEELDESNSMKGLLLDIIAHDLKNPAGVIKGFADFGIESDPDNEILQEIQSGTDSLLKVIDNTTVLSKVATGDEIDKEAVDITEIIKTITKESIGQLKLSNMKLDLKIKEPIIVNANPIISEVFRNYISNAIKYASSGKIIIVDAQEEDSVITVNVIDHGDTIAEKERVNIFKRSVQLGKTKGSGLGLAIVKRIAVAHKAAVGVTPNKPKGNIFYIKIPVS